MKVNKKNCLFKPKEEKPPRHLLRDDAKARQLIFYDGLEWGNMSPTDLDGVLEWKDKYYIFFEVKTGKAQLSDGQKLTLERLVRDTSKAGKISMAIVLEHSQYDHTKDVYVADCVVREFFMTDFFQWTPPKNTDMTPKEAIETFLDYAKEKRERKRCLQKNRKGNIK